MPYTFSRFCSRCVNTCVLAASQNPADVLGMDVANFMAAAFVGRIDLKSDRKTSTLLVQGAFGEKKIDKPYVAAELADELRLMADWLGLEQISVASKGDLAAPLKKALR